MSKGVVSAADPLVIGHYALFDELASGGMATVHLGRLLGPVGFGRTVAIKRLHQHFLQEPEFITMFMDEARIVARIVHPNVVPMFDIVQCPQGLFLIMEYVHGESLSRLLRTARAAGDPVSPRVACAILHGVLLGLHAAHETREPNGVLLDVVHRDVSPQNVMVGSDGVPRVLDFGIAKAAGRLQVTREGQIKGKLTYMAPEQIRGVADRRSDVFAAGVVLWEMLAGRRLHEGLKDVDMITRIITGGFGPPSAYAPGVPAVLDAIVHRALVVEPNERFATAREMALELERNVGLASPTEVSAWVARLGHITLEQRAAKIGAMERAASALVPVPVGAGAPFVEAVARPAPFDGTEVDVDLGALSGPMTSSSVFTHTQTNGGRVRTEGPRRPWLGGVVFGLSVTLGVIGALLCVYSLRVRSERAALQAARTAASVTTRGAAGARLGAAGSVDDLTPSSARASTRDGVTTTSATTRAAPIASAVGATGAASASASPSASPPSVAGSGRSGAPRPGTTARPGADASKKASCDPPYTVDATGHRHYKQECY